MATAVIPALSDEAITQQIKALLEGFQSDAAKTFATQVSLTQLAEAVKAEMKAETARQITEAKTDYTRLLKERTARPVPGFGGGEESIYKSLGERVADLPEFKQIGATESGKVRAIATINTRLRTPNQAKAITEAGSGYSFTPYAAPMVVAPRGPLVMRDLIPVITITGTNAIEYNVETWTYNADYQVAEGDVKAQGNVTWTPKSAMVRTIAWYVKVSRQMMADAPWFASTVDEQLTYGVMKKEDHEILWGDNAAGHLHGIMPQATALPAGVLVGVTTGIDTILAAIAHLQGLNLPPTGIVMNPIDFAQMQLTKTAQGAYVLGGPPAVTAPLSLWGLPLVLTPEMTANNFLVGSFRLNSAIFDREAVSVEVANENEDDFIRNMLTIRAEERLAFAVYRPQAFVKGTFPAPAALEAAGGGGAKK